MRKLRLTNTPSNNLLPHPNEAAVVAKVLGHAKHHASSLRSLIHHERFVRIHRQRLLAQDVLAMLQRQQHIVFVHRIRRSDEHHIHIR